MRGALLIGLCALALLAPATEAQAYWQAGGSGSGSATAATMPTANQPTATASGQNVTLTWAQNSFQGRPLGSYDGGGYTVRRYAQGSSTAITPNGGCATTIAGAGAALECVETGVPSGDWRYSVQPKLNSFTGEESPKSDTTTVTTAPPRLSFSSPTTITSPPTTLSGSISNFLAGEAVTFRLDHPTTGTELSGSTSPSPVPADGGASVSVTIPAGTSDGQHTIYAVGDRGSTASAAITVQALHHFDIDPVGEQHSGKSFAVTVRAKDASGQTITAYNGTVSFSTNSGSIATATTNNFVNGVLEGQAVKITGAYTTNQTITVTGGSPAKTGTSNAFTLRDWKLYLKKTAAITGSNCATAGVQRDMEEGYLGQDPEETYFRTNSTNTLRFCSRAFSAGETLAAGTTRLEGFTSSVNTQGPCNVTATLYRNGTEVLGSNSQLIPQGTGTVFTKTWLINTPAITFAAGDRLSVVLSWDTTAICREASFHYGGTTNRSRLELPGPGGSAYTDSVFSTAGLASYWRLEEATGQTATDSKGTNTGTHSTSSFSRRTGLLTTAPVGTAAWFSNHTMTAPDTLSLSPTSELSVEAWVQFLTCCSEVADIATKDWRLRKTSFADGNKYSFAVDTGTGYDTRVISTTSPASANNFKAHVVATYDGANLKIYVNGKLEGTQPKTGAVLDGNGPLAVGGSSGSFTQGTIDELAFYNRALTATEVRAHWNAR